jgi:hypothetical protein
MALSNCASMPVASLSENTSFRMFFKSALARISAVIAGSHSRRTDGLKSAIYA